MLLFGDMLIQRTRDLCYELDVYSTIVAGQVKANQNF